VDSSVVGMCDPELRRFVEDRGSYVGSKTVQSSGPIVILTMTESGNPIDKFPPVVGSSFSVIGGAMRLAGTEYVWHDAKVALSARLTF